MSKARRSKSAASKSHRSKSQAKKESSVQVVAPTQEAEPELEVAAAPEVTDEAEVEVEAKSEPAPVEAAPVEAAPTPEQAKPVPPRAPRAVVKLEVSATSPSNFFVGFAGNISEGGIFVATHQMLNIGETLELEFQLSDDDKTLRLQAEVRWQRLAEDAENDVEPGFGACFSELAKEDRIHLERFIETREPLFHPE